jgi:hypothetical protein
MDLEIDTIVKCLNRREFDAPTAAAKIKALVRSHLGPTIAEQPLAEIERYVDAACARQFGGDCEDLTLQTELKRRVKRMNCRRFMPPLLDGNVVWL